jgi:hypothetical protein
MLLQIVPRPEGARSRGYHVLKIFCSLRHFPLSFTDHSWRFLHIPLTGFPLSGNGRRIYTFAFFLDLVLYVCGSCSEDLHSSYGDGDHVPMESEFKFAVGALNVVGDCHSTLVAC